MKRDLASLENQEFDIVVVGGGIYGACVAWDAGLRGLSVALVEAGDFGHATSANSLKIIHGGLRYLKDGNPRLVRTMIRERATWLRIAPHLIHPLPCVMPTYRQPMASKWAMCAALTLNDLLGFDRNRQNDPQKHLPDGQLISRQDLLRMLPGLEDRPVTGGAVWFDAQVHNTERLLLAIVKSAVEAGATVANYVRVNGFLGTPTDVRGVHAEDVQTGEPLTIRAQLVVNCAGGWTQELLNRLDGRPQIKGIQLSTAVNLVTRQFLPDVAMGIPSTTVETDSTGQTRRRSRHLFVAPWRHYSLVGTFHAPVIDADCPPPAPEDPAAMVDRMLGEVNGAYPGAELTPEDVYHVHHGYLPAEPQTGMDHAVKLVRESFVYDHAVHDGITGLITVVGVKYTTARWAAQHAVDLVVRRLERPAGPCRTHSTPVHGGDIARFDDYLMHALRQCPDGLDPAVVEHLVYNYGTEYPTLLSRMADTPAWATPVGPGSWTTGAEIVHAMQQEMTVTLSDILLRRTDLGSAGAPVPEVVEACGRLFTTVSWSGHSGERALSPPL